MGCENLHTGRGGWIVQVCMAGRAPCKVGYLEMDLRQCKQASKACLSAIPFTAGTENHTHTGLPKLLSYRLPLVEHALGTIHPLTSSQENNGREVGW